MAQNQVSSKSEFDMISTPVSVHHNHNLKQNETPNLEPSSLSDAELLVKYIEQDSRCRKVVELTKKGKTLPPESQSPLQWLISLLIASPKDYHGKAYVTDSVKTQAGITANTNTIANWVDFISNYPFYFFSFQFLGNIPGVILGLLLDAGILFSSNLTASAVANRHQKNKSWARVGIQGMIALSLLKSIVSGVGVELLNNPSGIKQETANYLIERQINAIEAENEKILDSEGTKNAQQACQQGEAEFRQMGKNNPNRDALHIRLYGTWGERNKDWQNTPTEQLPLCVKASRLETQTFQAYENAKEKLSRQLNRRLEIGNDVIFLAEEMSGLYQSNFTPEGEIASPVMQVQMATLSFFGKLTRGEWANLGFALFFFSLSIITSAISVMMTIKYAQREDVQKSRDEDFAQKRNAELEKLWRDLVEKHHQELNNLKNN